MASIVVWVLEIVRAFGKWAIGVTLFESNTRESLIGPLWHDRDTVTRVNATVSTSCGRPSALALVEYSGIEVRDSTVHGSVLRASLYVGTHVGAKFDVGQGTAERASTEVGEHSVETFLGAFVARTRELHGTKSLVNLEDLFEEGVVWFELLNKILRVSQ